MLAALLAATPVASLEKVDAICASRIYDFLERPVMHFTIDTGRTQLITPDQYARYWRDLAAAAAPLGYDPADMSNTLHESLSAFPFLNRGIIREVIFVLCAAGGERDTICRRADYYIYDASIDSDRLSLMLMDILEIDAPAFIDACDFGKASWSELG
jgi:hypothetical protein